MVARAWATALGTDGGFCRVAEALSRRGIAVRAGLHCAPLAHAAGGTEQTGTVRVSVSAFNTSREITAFLAAMQALV